MRLHTETRGDGLPAVVVLPSFSLSTSAMTLAVEPAFADRAGSRRIYVDLPGTGGSMPGEPHSERVLQDVIDTIGQELAGEPFAVAGWSYGGFLAAGVARRLESQTLGLMMACSGFLIRQADRDLTGVLSSDPEPGWLAGVPGKWHDHFRHAIGRQSADVARRVAFVLGHNGPADDVYLARLRADGFSLSDERVPGPRNIPVCFLAGRRDRVAGYTGPYVAGQARQALANLGVALEESGATIQDVVKTTVFVASSDRADLVAAWNEVAAVFGGHDVPSTLLGVTVLGYPDQLVEIEAIAMATQDSAS